ncbi:glycoside hydrolase family 3 N-terminal domain-containing protein [Butyrivibrio sp. YAB3001]|uniref:glycoside hydrolase family 3 N-terminal domain-containing protein n=1 Tax=Butyrivibrio sp. YAB3001 TaxID=1520812 RepID=UPI0008F6832F|nr:glycoside hydrolase family 3 N-terminal domain-containing protein [Butyrivibrio sp. YAB3001]SFC65913.1 beta-glucosidase [Butyrivibrio sp. YAB3001]
MSKGRKIVGTIIRSILIVFLAMIIVALNSILPNYARMADSMIGGINTKKDNSKVDTTGLDLEYNKADYTKDSIKEAEAELHQRIADEGTILLSNEESALPKAADSVFSFFSVNSATVTANGSMTGGRSLKDIFSNAGVALNTELFEFYKEQSKNYGLGSGSISYGDVEDFSINEVPLSVLLENGSVMDSVKGTVPVYFLKRVAGEGRDMPRSMYSHASSEEDKARTYLEPDSTELEILSYLNENFDEIILVSNSNAALDFDFIKDFPNIKAVISATAIESLPYILTGQVNPSGRTVDTFASDPLSSPSAMNFGDYQYSDTNGNLTKYNYVTYEEGIYVGYKYYETRYEDVVLKQGNASDYDYTSEVVYPFGYGLSYTTFEWSDMDVSWSDDTCNITVNVKNTGSVSGKDVVEIYAQSPYTQYDIDNGVEKSSVQLVAYEKSGELAPGESETVKLSFDKAQLKAYDSSNAKTYIFDAGDYYITAAKNAHAAINNILAAKDVSSALVSTSGLSSENVTKGGDISFVSLYTPDNADVDTVTYAKDSYSGVDITNRLDDARGENTYLTRSDWTGTFPTHDGVPSAQISTWGNEINGSDGVSYTYTKTASDELIAQFDSFDSGTTVDKASLSETKIVYGADNGLKLIDLRGLDYDDPLWDDLLDELTAEEIYNAIGVSGYGIEYIKSIEKPFNIDADTASGLIYGGTGAMFPSAMTLAQCWNPALALEFGTMIGNEGLLGGADGWYAPSMNIHRTPFSGRNGEYYSEDAFLSGVVGSNAAYGAASKGMYTYIKHFAFNDQENHRGDRDGQYSIATWLNEQAAREIYLVPFEMTMKAGNVTLNYVEKQEDGSYKNASKEIRASQAVMTSFNRVGATWAGGDYGLLTGILRNEWDFDGLVMTDNANTGVYMDGYQMTEAGGDVKLTSLPSAARYNFDKNDPATYYYAREAMHHTLYTVVNSKAMNGAMPGTVIKDGTRTTDHLVRIVTVVCVLLIILQIYKIFRLYKPTAKKLAKLKEKAEKKAAKQGNT